MMAAMGLEPRGDGGEEVAGDIDRTSCFPRRCTWAGPCFEADLLLMMSHKRGGDEKKKKIEACSVVRQPMMMRRARECKKWNPWQSWRRACVVREG
jgi:hypothetical protein